LPKNILELSSPNEPFYCDYLNTNGNKERLLLNPKKVWYGTSSEFKTPRWLMLATNLLTDLDMIILMDNMNV
jgi:hypothetical protein